ncbi:hypothetical protein VZC37_18910 [Gordonia sp. LSe1-13]|uniref:Peptidase MA-like domain-containing protein n=1 Tax=Gordonia sesuvii TaxID=3116777 RepID=A0ABU7MHZ8_9ACTN|nr:hypothetical protein [Gordonia sp. LSe1-13]
MIGTDVSLARCASATGLVGLAVALIAGCGTTAPPVSPSSSAPSTTTSANVYEQQRTAGVQAALDVLGDALRSGDPNRVDTVVDAAAAPEFRRHLQVIATNLGGHPVAPESMASESVPGGSISAESSPPRSTDEPRSPTSSPSSPAPVPTIPPRGTALRLKEFRYEVVPSTEAEVLVPAGLQQRLDAQGSSDSWVAPVDLRYALGGAATPGLDEPDVTLNMQLVMARYGDDWKVVGDATAIGGTAAPAQLWDLPGLAATDVATDGGTSVIASYPGTAETVDRVRGLLPGAVVAVDEFWGEDWPRRAAVVATDRPAEFRALARSAGTDVTGAAAATVHSRVDTDDDVAVGQRVILTPGADQLSDAALGVVLRHELTHVATRVVTAAGAPLWITEGVSEYVGRKGTYGRFDDAAPDLAAQIRAGDLPADLPADRDFAVDSEEAVVAYQSAWSVAAFVADRFGEDELRTLYTGVAADADPRRSDQAISDALGVSRTDFVADWQRWLSTQVRR